ncbi:MAG: tRNA (guanosine(37)-N1)-methyltransferase TrmD, partial [Hyphomicrobiales bacterium]|nr:tRNA (guanosine(37)-N1)-methyltransferase TrmD [Hyphomicrobiales bacterium]
LLWMSAAGTRLTQARVQALAQGPGALFFCSRFEGVDQRAMDELGGEEICIGDYVLAGGEIAAMVMLDAIVRLLPGVVGEAASLTEESFADGLVEHAHYTRPAQWRGRAIPPVLLSGHHAQIAAFRRRDARARTRARRADLWRAAAARTKQDKA